MTKLKILHAPYNIGGMAGVLAQEQRKLGYTAHAYSFSDTQYKFNSDIFMKNPRNPDEMLEKANKFAKIYDVFHFYFGSSLLDSTLDDVHVLYKQNKTIAFYFCGCDIRDEKYTSLNYQFSACRDCFPKLCNRNREKAKLVSSLYAKVNFVSTPDLIEFVDRPVLLPQIVDFDCINAISDYTEQKKGDAFRIGHAPTSRQLKGTAYLISAVERLQKNGLNIELVLVENMPHDTALRLYKTVDIALDQLLCGSYGLLAAELMALGVPVAVYIRPDLLPLYKQNPPVIPVDIHNLEDVLVYYYENRELLSAFRTAGVEYARAIHNPIIAAKTCLEWYEK